MAFHPRNLILYFLAANIQPLSGLPVQTAWTFEGPLDLKKPKITFKPDGSFKITVLSDIHMGEDEFSQWGPEQDRKSIMLLRKVLREENMDYVILNGDQITGENTYRHNSTKYVDQIVGPLNEIGVPFSSVYGNHDNQSNITHLEEINRELLVARNSYTRRSPRGVGGEGGEGNYWVPVYHQPYDTKPSLVLWFFDSRGGNSPGPNSHPVEDWVHPSVARWIHAETDLMNIIWGPAEKRGALAFVHIPPCVLVMSHNADSDLKQLFCAKSTGESQQHNQPRPEWRVADHMRKGDSQPEGKDDAFWSALVAHIPNLHAVISGHEHGNEWCARERKDKMVFCFAKHSGHGGYGGPGWGFGVRNLLFDGFDTVSSMKTWIRMEDGELKAPLDINDAFDP